MIGLIGAALALVLLTGATVWTLPRGKRWWVGVLGAVLLFGAPFLVAVNLYVFQQHGGSPRVEKDGKYFTSSHSQLTEVSEEVWRRLRLFERITWVAAPAGILAGIYLLGGYLNSAQDRAMAEQQRNR